MKSLLFHIWWAALVAALAAGGCVAQRPAVRIGFAGELTGLYAGLSVDGRDGALLAVEHINAAGGVAGRPLELLVRDDQGAPGIARAVDADLIDQGVVAIVGHFTSGQTKAAYDTINAAHTILLSPTTTSTDFNRRDDAFFRVIPDNQGIGLNLAKHMFVRRGVRRLVGIYDLANLSYTSTVWQAISAEFNRLGSDDIRAVPFTSGHTDLKKLAADAAALRPDGVVFVASSVDTALMVQYYRQTGDPARLFTAPWSQTDEFLEKGGKAIAGVELSTFYNAENPYPEFHRFQLEFEARYRRTPGFPAAYAYEAILALADALQRTKGEKQGLKEALLQVRDLPGVQGPLTFDSYGDMQRDIYIAVVENARFRVIETIQAGAD